VKKIFLLIAIFCAQKASSQPYSISFAGVGLSTTVNTVKVENLTSSISLTLNEGDILRLTGTTGVYSFENRQSSELKVYPNPMTDNSILQIYPSEAGSAVITVFDMTGKLVAKSQSYLENSLQEFRLSGMNSGFYLISVKGNSYQYSGRLLCNTKSTGIVSIEKISINIATYEKTSNIGNKGTQATVDMAYTTGDRLKFTGISGIYSTVITDIPSSDKTITFNFIACTDGDNNNYPVVPIGAQTWMAENLKTIKYNDGTLIPLVEDEVAWAALTSPGYCWYDNDEPANKTTYGVLYNWYSLYATSNGGKNVCPPGWHVPSSTQWTTLLTYLGGESIAGGKLKNPAPCIGSLLTQVRPTKWALRLFRVETVCTKVLSAILEETATGGLLPGTILPSHGMRP
jgi:uncharacterized protein (TIGR02145 family)